VVKVASESAGYISDGQVGCIWWPQRILMAYGNREDLPSNIWLPNLDPVTREDAVRGRLIEESETGGWKRRYREGYCSQERCCLMSPHAHVGHTLQVGDMQIP